jgi:hypothetical protein
MLYSTKNTHHASQLSKQCLQKKLRKIYHGLYSDDFTSPIEAIIQRDWMEIVAHIVPHGILSYRTALALKPLPCKGQSIVFITSSYAKTIQLPGLIIKVHKGDHEKFLEQVIPTLARSNTTRTLLENLTSVRGADYIGIKTVDTAGVEKQLTKILGYHGEEKLNHLRDEAKSIAKTLNYEHEFKKLNQLISALLATHADKTVLITPYAKAAAQKKPYDEHRIKLFDALVIYLKKCFFLERHYQYHKNTFKHLSFYEAYFSNFIEGTQFMIDEAEDIVFQGKEIENRHADSHDVLSNFIITNDYTEMLLTPKSPEELIELLQKRHAILMKERPEKNPGEFKHYANQAGNTQFVTPKETLGTLYQGFERYALLNPGLEKALFMHFLISEVHPFHDGNGRLSRLMMNAELVNHTHFKIIIPSVHRDNYLNGLRIASRDSDFRTYVKVMDQAHAYTASLHWHDYGEVRNQIEIDNAHLTSDEGIPVFNRALRKLRLSDIAP